jgi:hypothetical protein
VQVWNGSPQRLLSHWGEAERGEEELPLLYLELIGNFIRRSKPIPQRLGWVGSVLFSLGGSLQDSTVPTFLEADVPFFVSSNTCETNTVPGSGVPDRRCIGTRGVPDPRIWIKLSSVGNRVSGDKRRGNCIGDGQRYLIIWFTCCHVELKISSSMRLMVAFGSRLYQIEILPTG